MRRILAARVLLSACLVMTALAPTSARAQAPRTRGVGDAKPLSHSVPQRQAPYQPGRSPYVTGARPRPKYFVPPTNPRTPTWKMYGLPAGVKPGDWPTYAPFGFGGYRFPAVGNQAYR